LAPTKKGHTAAAIVLLSFLLRAAYAYASADVFNFREITLKKTLI
jgi:hypothetical protein